MTEYENILTFKNKFRHMEATLECMGVSIDDE